MTDTQRAGSAVHNGINRCNDVTIKTSRVSPSQFRLHSACRFLIIYKPLY